MTHEELNYYRATLEKLIREHQFPAVLEEPELEPQDLEDRATADLVEYLKGQDEEMKWVIAEKSGLALKRMERGTFGYCVECGKQLGEERLRAMPWVELCVNCQGAKEAVEASPTASHATL
jgi:RNA polymerase-binding transcription factor